MTDSKKYLNPQQYFRKLEEKDRTIRRLQEENARLRHSLTKFMKVEIDLSKTRIEKVKQIINERYSVDIDVVTRQRVYVNARRVYYSWMKKNTTLSLDNIAATLNTKHDHATVLWALESHEDLMETDKQYKKEVEAILAFIDVHAPLEK